MQRSFRKLEFGPFGPATATLALLACCTAFLGNAQAQAGAPVRSVAEAPVRTGRIVQRALPPLVHAPLGERAPVITPEGEVLGTFEDHVIDLATGAVTFVVVRTPDAARLVPYARFRWDAEDAELYLSARPEELAGLPVFDPSVLQTLDPFGRAVEGEAARPLEASSRAEGEAPPRNVTARDVLGATLLVGDRASAATSALLLEPTIGRVRFLLAHEADDVTGADPLVLPWSSLAWRPRGEEGRAQYALEVPSGSLVGAPRLAGADPSKLADRELRDTIRSFYRAVVPMRGGAAARAKGARG